MSENSAPSEARRFDILESVPDAIIIADGAGKIVFINAQTEKLFGYARSELLGLPVEVLLPERFRGGHPSQREQYMAAPAVRPMGSGLTLYALHKEGGEFPAEISLSPFRTQDGLLVVSSVRDASERKRFEQTLQQKNLDLENANFVKDRFLASMSHELRTPLNAVIGFTGTLLMKFAGPLTADQESQLKTIRSSGKQLLALIDDLLYLAKIEAGDVELALEPVVCQSVIDEVSAALRPAAENKGLAFNQKAPKENVTLMTDRRALSHIVTSLTHNAIKFTSAGRVALELAQYQENGKRVTEIKAIDSGIGIRGEDQTKLFELFTGAGRERLGRDQGAGLGLYLSRKLALLIGGRITLQSEPGKGSVFTLLLTSQ